MSAAGRNLAKDGRQEDDHYSTPAWIVYRLMPWLHEELRTAKVILDPCAGKGAILTALHEQGVAKERMWAIELNEAHLVHIPLADDHKCATDALPSNVSWARPNLIITNPPYAKAMEFIQKSIDELAPRGTVAMLLRVGFLGSAKRAEFHRSTPCDFFLSSQRPEFVASIKCLGNTRGNATCDWATVQDLKAQRPTTCPKCSKGVDVTTSDMSEYAWFVWGPGRGNRWAML